MFLMLDVLEHIKEPVSFLKDLKKNISLSPDSHVIITVPAFQFLFSKHDRFLGHYRRYTEKMLTEQLAEAGFALVESGYFFTSLLLPRALGVLVEKMLRKKQHKFSAGRGRANKKNVS
jgi:2-polyprenyl-3-methyl-5-hydroxy-6-metoxy-1,4-benzoquinol methylase